MDPVNIASIVIALITVGGAYASNRASAKAGKRTVEGEAYERARKFDIDTIERQDGEIKEVLAEIKEVRVENAEVRIENKQLRIENRELRLEVEELRERVAALERKEEKLADFVDDYGNAVAREPDV